MVLHDSPRSLRPACFLRTLFHGLCMNAYEARALIASTLGIGAACTLFATCASKCHAASVRPLGGRCKGLHGMENASSRLKTLAKHVVLQNQSLNLKHPT